MSVCPTCNTRWCGRATHEAQQLRVAVATNQDAQV